MKKTKKLLLIFLALFTVFTMMLQVTAGAAAAPYAATKASDLESAKETLYWLIQRAEEVMNVTGNYFQTQEYNNANEKTREQAEAIFESDEVTLSDVTTMNERLEYIIEGVDKLSKSSSSYIVLFTNSLNWNMIYYDHWGNDYGYYTVWPPANWMWSFDTNEYGETRYYAVLPKNCTGMYLTDGESSWTVNIEITGDMGYYLDGLDESSNYNAGTKHYKVKSYELDLIDWDAWLDAYDFPLQDNPEPTVAPTEAPTAAPTVAPTVDSTHEPVYEPEDPTGYWTVENPTTASGRVQNGSVSILIEYGDVAYLTVKSFTGDNDSQQKLLSLIYEAAEHLRAVGEYNKETYKKALYDTVTYAIWIYEDDDFEEKIVEDACTSLTLAIEGAPRREIEKYWVVKADVDPTEEPETQPTETVSLLVGDVNLNGVMDITDATLIQRHVAKLITLSDEALAVADTNGDGSVDVVDATVIQRTLAGLMV